MSTGQALAGKRILVTRARHQAGRLADALEALMGAVFVDQGLAVARDFIMRIFADHLDMLGELGKDFKGELQEKTQKLFRGLPQYTVVHEEGPPHSKSFSVEVNFGSTVLGQGVGTSKKQAQQAAAQQALEQFDDILTGSEPLSDTDTSVSDKEADGPQLAP